MSGEETEDLNGGINRLARLFGSATIEEAHQKGRAQLEQASEQLRLAILKADPSALAGYLWGQLLMAQLTQAKAHDKQLASPHVAPPEVLEPVVLALEYLHAVLSGHAEDTTGSAQDDESLREVLSASSALREVVLRYGLVAAAALPGNLDYETRTLGLHAISSWTMLRGHRYQALEEEFFDFVLDPHDDALKQAYGVGSKEVARGIQAAVDATRFGHMKAAELLLAEWKQTLAEAERAGVPVKEVMQTKYASEDTKAHLRLAVLNLFFAGNCDVGKTSGLPPSLLEDLSFARGEETLFFAEGPLRGTPMRRLPARERPLVRFNGSYYAFDPNFLRDSAYRAIQWGLGRRLAGYEKTWGERQAIVTESAFPTVMGEQLAGATVLSSVYYPDPDTGKWVENDLVILLNDALLQIEVKAGVMPMHSPEMHFDRHARTVQALVVKAKQQSERFFRYAASADEVPLFNLHGGAYVEVHRLRLAKYRLLLPIGLTVEAFTPFSAMSKRLPEMAPILGKYPFISMSVDDLFVLARFLPSSGDLFHYLAVRQRVAGQLNAAFIDELDHLGRYVTQNRIDMFNEEHFSQGATLITHAGASDVVDAYFSDPDWQKKPPPHQSFPPRVQKLLTSLDVVRGPRFLHADAAVRDLSGQGRDDLSALLEKFLPFLKAEPYRWAVLGGEDATLVWVQRAEYADVRAEMAAKAEAAALAMGVKTCTALVIYVGADDSFEGGWAADISAPPEIALRRVDREREGQAMLGKAIRRVSIRSEHTPRPRL